MLLIKPSFKIEAFTSIYLVEEAGRTCYKSEHKTHSNSAAPFIKSIIKLGHESVLEHSMLSVRFIVDRGFTHELVRHRLVAFSQESTRYCNYSGGVTFIIPPWVNIEEGKYSQSALLQSSEKEKGDATTQWFNTMLLLECAYMALLDQDNWIPQQARSVLPNSLKTEIVATANFREWRHIFKLRALGTSGKPHPQMLEIMIPLLEKVKRLIPVIFDDLEVS